MRPSALFLLVLFFAVNLMSAQSVPTSSRANVFAGYSYFNTNISPISRASTYGWEGSLEVKAYRWIGIVGDIDTHYGSEGFQLCQTFPVSGNICAHYTANIIERNFLVGPRVAVTFGSLRPFAHILVGDAHVNAGNFAGKDDSFAAAAGGGVDFNVTPRFGWRVQGDYLRTLFFSARQDNVRVSTGLVIRF